MAELTQEKGCRKFRNNIGLEISAKYLKEVGLEISKLKKKKKWFPVRSSIFSIALPSNLGESFSIISQIDVKGVETVGYSIDIFFLLLFLVLLQFCLNGPG